MTHIIVQDGKVIGSWNVGGAMKLLPKMKQMCKKLFEKTIWADGFVAMPKDKRRDPDYVVLKNSGKQCRIVVVNEIDATENWLNDLCELYGWNVG